MAHKSVDSSSYEDRFGLCSDRLALISIATTVSLVHLLQFGHLDSWPCANLSIIYVNRALRSFEKIALQRAFLSLKFQLTI